MKQGVFITGTDTGVGKTIIAAAITRALKIRGLRVGAMKPVETGCKREGDTLVPIDGAFLQYMSESDIPLSDVTTYRLETPVAPLIASEIEGMTIKKDVILKTFEKVSRDYDFMVVEGVGGVMVPVNEDLMVIDIIKLLGLPVVVVARNTLGIINHALLTVRAVVSEGIPVAGVIINHTRPRDGTIAENTNPSVLKKLLGVPLLGVFPYIKETSKEEIDKASLKALDIEPLLSGS